MTQTEPLIAATEPSGDRATALTDDDLSALRARTRQIDTSSIDHRQRRRIEAWWNRGLQDWATAVVGHRVTDLRHLPWSEWVLLDLAHSVEPTPPLPPGLAAQLHREHTGAVPSAHAWTASVQAIETEWMTLRRRLPARVAVAHSYTSGRHTEPYVHGSDHILLHEDLRLGSHSLTALDPLCFTPSRAADLSDFPHLNTPADRWPTCRACIRIAYQLAGRKPSQLLLPVRPRPHGSRRRNVTRHQAPRFGADLADSYRAHR